MSLAVAERNAAGKQPAVVDSTVCGKLQFELCIIWPSGHVEELLAVNRRRSFIVYFCRPAAGPAPVAFHPSFSRSIACRARLPTETIKQRPTAAGRPLASRNENAANSRIFRETSVRQQLRTCPSVGLAARRAPLPMCHIVAALINHFCGTAQPFNHTLLYGGQ